MIFSIILPNIVAGMISAEVSVLHCAPGDELNRGGRILDLKLDLSAVFEHDCPPVSFYRLAASSRLWVREVLVKPGQAVKLGETLALCSTTPDEELAEPPHEPARVSVIAILGQFEIWT